jgi:acetyl esterase
MHRAQILLVLMRTLTSLLILMASLAILPAAASAEQGCDPASSEHVVGRTPSGPMKVHVFLPPTGDPGPRPALVIFHGGGWIMGEPSWAFALANRFACSGMVAVAAQYRLADGKTASPVEAVDDAMNAIAWTRANAERFGIDPEKVAALGWSAGAHLAAAAAAFSTDRAQRPDLLALISPAVSVVEDGHFVALLPTTAKAQDFSPAEHVRAGLPPTVIVTGRTDTVTPLTGVVKFHERMVAAGNTSVLHVYDGVGHLFTPAGQPDDGFPAPDKAVQQQAYEAIDRFLVDQGYLDQKPGE